MIIVLWIVFSLIVGAIGSGRNIGFAGAFLLSLLLSPLIGLIITLISKDKQTDKVEKALLTEHQQKQNDLQKISSSEVTKQLEQLDKTKNSGLITTDEYEKIRKRVLDRIG